MFNFVLNIGSNLASLYSKTDFIQSLFFSEILPRLSCSDKDQTPTWSLIFGKDVIGYQLHMAQLTANQNIHYNFFIQSHSPATVKAINNHNDFFWFPNFNALLFHSVLLIKIYHQEHVLATDVLGCDCVMECLPPHRL